MKEELLDVTKKSGIVFIGKVVGLLFGVLFNFVAARYMGAQVYGSFMYVYTLISFFPIAVKLGLDQGLVSFIPKLIEEDEIEKRNSLITFCLVLTLSLALLLSIIIIINGKFIAINILNNSELSNLIKSLAPIIVLLSFMRLSRGIFRAVGKIKYFVLGKNVIISSLKLFFVLIFSFLGYKLYGLVSAFYIGLLINSVYLFNIMRKLDLLGFINTNETDYYKKILKFSFPLLLTGLFNFFIRKTDVFMIGYFLSEDKVGIYNITLRIGTMSSFILTAFNTMFAPVISSLYHKDEMKKLENMYKAITKWIFGTNLVAFSLILLFNNEIMHVFGAEFIVGSTALILISMGQVVNAGVGSAGYISVMTGNPQYEFYNSTLTVSVNIMLNYFLIPVYGLEGAAFASLTSIAISNLLKLGLVFKDHEIHPYSFDYIKMLLILVGMFTGVYILNINFHFFWLFKLILLSAIFILGFIIIYYLTGMSKEDEIILNSILRKIR